MFELRTYTAADGKLQALHNRFRDHTVALFKKHDMESLGYFVARRSGEAEHARVPHCAQGREASKKNWADFLADPEWRKVSAESEANGRLDRGDDHRLS